MACWGRCSEETWDLSWLIPLLKYYMLCYLCIHDWIYKNKIIKITRPGIKRSLVIQFKEGPFITGMSRCIVCCVVYVHMYATALNNSVHGRPSLFQIILYNPTHKPLVQMTNQQKAVNHLHDQRHLKCISVISGLKWYDYRCNIYYESRRYPDLKDKEWKMFALIFLRANTKMKTNEPCVKQTKVHNNKQKSSSMWIIYRINHIILIFLIQFCFLFFTKVKQTYLISFLCVVSRNA